MRDEGISAEEMCRQLLFQAEKDGLVAMLGVAGECAGPGQLSSGDLAGMANLLSVYLTKAQEGRK